MKKHSIRTMGKGLVLGALAMTVAGCVADPYPTNYYRGYPGDYHYYGYSETTAYPAGSTVIIRHDRDNYQDYNRRDNDDHWDNGRRGNGNYHGGTDQDHPHDD